VAENDSAPISNAKMPRNSALTRKQILDVAYRLLYQRGFARVSLDNIAEAAGIAKRSVYYHFESKDKPVAAVRGSAVRLPPAVRVSSSPNQTRSL